MIDWFYVKDGAQTGPVTEAELRDLLDTKAIPTDTLVWHASMSDWIEAQNTAIFSSSVITTTSDIQAPVPTAAATKLEVGELVKEAFATFKSDWLNLSVISLVLLVICFFIGFMAGLIPSTSVENILSTFLTGFLIVGFSTVCLAKIDGKKFAIQTLFSRLDTFLMAGLVSIGSSILIAIGIILLIIPGLIIAGFISLWPFLFADRLGKDFSALDLAWKLGKNHLLPLALILLINAAVCIAGFLCLGVGIIPALAFCGILTATTYRKLVPRSVEL